MISIIPIIQSICLTILVFWQRGKIKKLKSFRLKRRLLNSTKSLKYIDIFFNFYLTILYLNDSITKIELVSILSVHQLII
jgi:hypothetical protein